jgi:hypothetical protein
VFYRPKGAGVYSFDVKAHDWDNIVELYEGFEPVRPMLNLVRSIREAGLTSQLYAITSMYDLLLAQTPVFNFSGSQVLRIVMDFRRDELSFKFQDYRKICSSSEGFRTLVFILTKRLRWLK